MPEQRPAILVVDDDPDTCRNLADILGDLGYHVETASDGLSALGLIRQRAFDVALLDFKMPGMTGLELYREIRKLRAETVAIVVSAFTNTDTRQEALAAGARHVLSKPVDFNRLLALVEEAIGQPLVLVVDDDPDLCTTLWDILRERGYRVALAHDPVAAAEQLQGHHFSVVLLDLRLPGGDGSQVFRTIREANPEAHTVIITGHPRELGGLVEQVLREGADAVCYKPFDVSQLLTTVEQLTRRTPATDSN